MELLQRSVTQRPPVDVWSDVWSVVRAIVAGGVARHLRRDARLCEVDRARA